MEKICKLLNDKLNIKFPYIRKDDYIFYKDISEFTYMKNFYKIIDEILKNYYKEINPNLKLSRYNLTTFSPLYTEGLTNEIFNKIIDNCEIIIERKYYYHKENLEYEYKILKFENNILVYNCEKSIEFKEIILYKDLFK